MTDTRLGVLSISLDEFKVLLNRGCGVPAFHRSIVLLESACGGYFIYLVSSILVIAVSLKQFEPMTGLAVTMANLSCELKLYFWTASRLLIPAVAIISMPPWQLTMHRDELSLQGRLYQPFQETLCALQETQP